MVIFLKKQGGTHNANWDLLQNHETITTVYQISIAGNNNSGLWPTPGLQQSHGMSRWNNSQAGPQKNFQSPVSWCPATVGSHFWRQLGCFLIQLVQFKLDFFILSATTASYPHRAATWNPKAQRYGLTWNHVPEIWQKLWKPNKLTISIYIVSN